MKGNLARYETAFFGYDMDMVNRAFLEKGYRSRPRRTVAIRGFISLLVVGVAFAFIFLYVNRPEFFAFLDGIQTSFPETTSTLRDLIDFYFIHVLLATLLLIYPVIRIIKTASLRAMHWFLAFPALVLELGLVAIWAMFGIPPVAANFDASMVIDIQTKWMGLLLYIQMGLLAFCSLVEMFYCVFPSVKYRKIYRLRRNAIAYARQHRGESGYRTPAQVKRDFYRYYAKKDFEGLMNLLYVYVVDKVGEGKLTDDEFEYFVAKTAKLDGIIRSAELAYLRKEEDYALMKAIYDRLATRASSSECGQKKAMEDAAYDRLAKDGEAKVVTPVTPPIQTKVAPPSAPSTPSPSKPVPPPSAVGEAWKKEKR